MQRQEGTPTPSPEPPFNPPPNGLSQPISAGAKERGGSDEMERGAHLRSHGMHRRRLAAAGRAVQQQAARPADAQRRAFGALQLRPGDHLR